MYVSVLNEDRGGRAYSVVSEVEGEESYIIDDVQVITIHNTPPPSPAIAAFHSTRAKKYHAIRISK